MAVEYSKAEVLFVEPDDDVYGAARNAPRKDSWTDLLSTQELKVSPLVKHCFFWFSESRHAYHVLQSVDEASTRVAVIMWTSGQDNQL